MALLDNSTELNQKPPKKIQNNKRQKKRQNKKKTKKNKKIKKTKNIFFPTQILLKEIT